MSDPNPELLNRAAVCYQRIGEPAEAARCYREAGSYRRAAELYERLDRFRDAALDHGRADNPDLAAWLLVHHVGDNPDLAAWLLVHQVGDPAGARAQLVGAAAPAGDTLALRRRLVLARCDIAEGRPPKAAGVLADAAAELARPRAVPDPYLESWSVAVAEAMGRPDQVALLFAAAVRGGRYGAEERWRAWMRDTLHAELVLPAAPTPAGR